MSMKTIWGLFGGVLVAALLMFGGPAGEAEAHTKPTFTSANSKVLRIYFAQPIRRGTVRVRNARGKVVSKGRGGRDPRNISVLKVGLRNVRNGLYKATWSMIALDGHRQTGTLRFRVR
ncbi:MAG: copper resistance protein CopC [Solirubrobacterales bacterium]|nr:copper resistance protein CopC [Solirubrobacterales bacterium]